MACETHLQPAQLIQPMFVVPGTNVATEIDTLPHVFHYSVDRLADAAKKIRDTGVVSVLLFGTPTRKDAQGASAWDPHETVQRACTELREKAPELCIITDVCLCAYTSHGHCGVVASSRTSTEVQIDNDASLPLLANTALSHVRAGAHMVAPSDMMDGRVAAIRRTLDDHQYTDIPIMSYAAKFASAFYGPFRGAQASTPEQGDRSSYQMAPTNAREALQEIQLDLEEGADILMVKPALPYLDIIAKARAQTTRPIAAYHVSGEYAMLHAAANAGLLDYERSLRESLLAIKRAGADLIITYAAAHVAATL